MSAIKELDAMALTCDLPKQTPTRAAFLATTIAVLFFAPKVGLIPGMKINSVVKIDPEIMSGEPCFAGTRVPVRTLLDYLEGGDTMDDFLEDFPTVAREQADGFLSDVNP